jgi:hypothetical protein
MTFLAGLFGAVLARLKIDKPQVPAALLFVDAFVTFFSFTRPLGL